MTGGAPYWPLDMEVALDPGDAEPGDLGPRYVATVTAVGPGPGEYLTVHVYESPITPGMLVLDVDGAIATRGPVTGIKIVINDQDVYTTPTGS